MKLSAFQALLCWVRVCGRVGIFLLHAGLLVPGLIFWGVVILLHGDMTALALASDNLISRYLAASMAEQQNFLGLCWVGAIVLYFIVAGFRWRYFWRDMQVENGQFGGQRND